MTTFSKALAIIIGTGAAVLIAGTTLYRYNYRSNKIPEKWVEVGIVSGLRIYPLKSGRGIDLEEAECTVTGLVLKQENKYTLQDRGILVYNEKDGQFRTAKQYAKLVLITVEALNEHEIKIEGPDVAPLILNLSFENPEVISCTLWFSEPQKCIDLGNKAAEWISQYCLNNDSGLRLGLNADWKRNVTDAPLSSLTGVYNKLKDEDLGLFADVASYMIMNRNSLDDLNKKLPSDVSISNFRPNIIIDGPKAFAEDDWDWIKIGDNVIFRHVMPCTRCTFVNLDPETGIPIAEQAVLRKLQEYRLVTNEKEKVIHGKAPRMGIYAGARKPGRVKLGDKVYVG